MIILDKGRTGRFAIPIPVNRTPSQPGDRWGLHEQASSLIRRRQRRAGVIGCELDLAGDRSATTRARGQRGRGEGSRATW